MEWVETTGKTIEEATSLALDQLGVDLDEAEIEVLDEPKSGLFGRVRSEARLRARVRPVEPRAKDERRRSGPKASRGPKGDSADSSSAKTAPIGDSSAASRDASSRDGGRDGSRDGGRDGGRGQRRPRFEDAEPLDAVPEAIATAGEHFLSGLVASMGLTGSIECSVVNANMIEFRIVGRDLGVLIGPKAQTLQAAQELLRTYIHYETQSSSGRILLDVGGYRVKRKAALITFTQNVANEVIASGERRALEAMSAPDRKVIHDCVQDIAGVVSSSEGEDPNRYVVLFPGS